MNRDVSGVRFGPAGQGSDQGCFSSAVGTQQRNSFVHRDLERDALKRSRTPVRFGEVFDLDRRWLRMTQRFGRRKMEGMSGRWESVKLVESVHVTSPPF